MILEFTGLSGAGKSTAEPYIISSLEQRGYHVVLRRELRNSYIKKKIYSSYEDHRVYRVVSNRLYNLGSWKSLAGARLAGWIFRGTFSRGRRKSFLQLGEDVKLSQYFINNYREPGEPPGVYIPQEGFVHHIACCRLQGDNGFPGLSEKLLKKYPVEKSMIIYFKVSVDEALDRLLKRGLPESWPRRINSRSRIKEFLLRFNQGIEDSVAKFQENGIKVYPVDASLDPKQVESQIGGLLDVFPKNEYNEHTEKAGSSRKREKYTG